MSPLLHWLTSPEWALVVKALLHSLWQGALVALGLALAFRWVVNPVTRYRLALVALGVMFTVSLITWGLLNAPQSISPGVPPGVGPVAAAPIAADPVQKFVVIANRTQSKPAVQWTAWLALVWLLGASAMLGRASVKVAGAEQLRRSCQPLNDSHIGELVAEARRAVKLTRQVRLAVTNQLTSPAVVGVLVPTLILPLSLITTLTPEQLRFILLHELAHIRRGDYLANLFQLFAEALFFFNPAVWWLSHQIRREREACCDALAIELSGAPADYARTLVSVAETMLQPAPAAAPAFGNDREPSSLADRVHRVLVPGYRPSLRLTWRAMLAALAAGVVLLGLLAAGTRETVAAILPAQRNETGTKKADEPGNVTPATASKREVIFRFKPQPGVEMQGTVLISIPDENDPRDDARISELRAIQNGEVRVEIPVGGRTFIESKQTTGFWFGGNPAGYVVTSGSGPMVIEIPTVPAGVISVKVRNADGSIADSLRLSIMELNPSPSPERWVELRSGTFVSQMFNSADRTVDVSGKEPVSLSLPLGGTYRLVGQRGYSICVSEPIDLATEKPMVEAELEFGRRQKLECRVLDSAAQPVKRAEVQVSFAVGDRRNSLKPLFTDEDGLFHIPDATPGAGDYAVEIHAPGWQAERVSLDFARQPNTIQLKPGLKISGRVLDENTGEVAPSAVIQAWSSGKYPIIATTRTDAEGWFEFNTLGATTYTITASGAEWKTREIKAGQKEPVVLKVKLNPGSQLVPVAPSAAAKLTTAADPSTGLPASGGTNLFTRSFKVDTNEFARALGMVGPMGTTNFQAAIRDFFDGLGVELQTPPKSVFYSDRRGQLLVRSTLVDLDKIERALQVMKEPLPQLNIQAKFIEVPDQLMTNALFEFILKTNQAGSLSGVLTDPQARVFFKALEQMEGVEILSAPEVTTLSGRQAQIQVVDMKTVVTGVTATITNGAEVVRLPQTTNMPFGPVLDVVPYVAADGRSIQMVVIPTVTEFFGYDDPGSVVSAKAPIPHYRVRQIPTSTPNNIPDGQTLVMGGFTSEDVWQLSQGVVSRQRTSGPNKKHLLVFVTPTIIDAAGNRVHTDEEMPYHTNAVPKQPGK